MRNLMMLLIVLLMVIVGAPAQGQTSEKPPPPVILSFTPTDLVVSAGRPPTVKVIGSNFVEPILVYIGLVKIRTRVVTSSTLELAIGQNVSSGFISVQTPGGTVTATTKLQVTPAPVTSPAPAPVKPTITAVSPAAAVAPGELVYLTGTNLMNNVGSVKVGGRDASFTYDFMMSRLAVTVPAGTTTGAFVTLKDSTGTYEVTSPTPITIRSTEVVVIPAGCPRAMPTVTPVSYRIGRWGGEVKRVTGANIECASAIRIGSTPVSAMRKVTIGTAVAYDITTPALDPGKYPIVITTPAGTVTSGLFVTVLP